MSLFKTIQHFGYQCPDGGENYDSFSLTCARLNADNEQQKDNVIITSHSGYISILQPSINDDSTDEQLGEYHPQVIYESQLNEPILGALCGNFSQYTQKQDRQNVIAILHPRKLVIYSLLTVEGIVEHGQQSKLQMLHQHDLQKSAFTFCKGNFGAVKGKEFICVMFLDGSLKFFEQDGISQNCVLPGNRTIPTTFIYVPRTDCFLIQAPNWDIECYRYLTLSESQERRFNPIWSLNIGEYVLDLNSHQISNTESLIVLLGENNLMCISDTGKMKFIKKLDYTPVAFCSFVVGWYWEPDCKLMIAVATDNGSLLIYQHSTLVWCAELMTETIALKRGNFTGLAGAIVTLNSSGKLSIGYLGSDPHIFKVPPLNLSKLDYEKSKMELEEMEREINSSVDNSDIPFINAQAEKDLEVQSQLSFHDLNNGVFAQLHLTITPRINLEQIQLVIIHNPAFIIPSNIFFHVDLPAHETHSFDAEIYLSETDVGEIFSTTLTIMVSFVNKQSIARVLKHCIDIPLSNVVQISQPQKDGIFKVTLNAAANAELNEIFRDITTLETSSQAVAFRTLNSENTVTLIAAKNSNRYRLQTNGLVSLAFMLGIIIERLTNMATTTSDVEGRRSVTVKSIPSSTIEFLLSCIEKHCGMKDEMKGIVENLTSKSIEMRLFERCFLAKMQGKVSSESTEGIEMLLKDTYNEILALTAKYKELKNGISRVETQLTSTIYFIRKVIEYADLPQKITENLLCIMRPGLIDFHETGQSWIETMAPYVDYLYNIYQQSATKDGAQFYDNFSFRNDNFSLTRFSKQLRHILSVLIVTTTSTNNESSTAPFDDKRTMEKVLITMEEDEMKIDESEWSSKLNPTYEIIANNDDLSKE